MHTIFLASHNRLWFLRSIVNASATSEIFQQLKMEQNLRLDHTIAVLIRDNEFIVANESREGDFGSVEFGNRNTIHTVLSPDLKRRYKFIFELPQFRHVR